jgi:ankyrin repeat protein
MSKDLQIATELRNAAIEGNVDKLRQLLDQGVDVNMRTLTGLLYTPLHNSVSRGHLEAVKFLVERGADLNATNSEGETALHLAVKHRFPKIIEYLIEKGADIEATDNKGNNLLHTAALVSHPDLVRIMSESKNALKESGPSQLLLQTSRKTQTNMKTIINTLNTILMSGRPIFFRVVLRTFLDKVISISRLSSGSPVVVIPTY